MLFRTLLIVALVAHGSSVFAEEFTGKVVGVADGDTITVLHDKTQVKIRLQAVDCPEKAQPFGTKAKQFTSEMVFGKIVTVKVATKDRYGRTVAWIDVGGKSLNEELLRAGFAWHYKQYDKSEKLAKLEQEARAAKRGLWADANPTPPWEWRHGKQQKPECKVPTDCAIRLCCCQWVAFAKNGPLPEKCSLRCRCANPSTKPQGATCSEGRCQVVGAAALVDPAPERPQNHDIRRTRRTRRLTALEANATITSSREREFKCL